MWERDSITTRREDMAPQAESADHGITIEEFRIRLDRRLTILTIQLAALQILQGVIIVALIKLLP